MSIPGLCTEIPSDITPTARTIAILHILERDGVVRMQFDDSSDDDQCQRQLLLIAQESGYDFISGGMPHVVYLLDPHQILEL